MNVVRDDGSSLNFGENTGCTCKNDRPVDVCSTNVIGILFGYVVRVIQQLKCFLGFGPQLTIKLVIEAPSSPPNCDTNDQRSKSADRRGCRTRCKRPEPECPELEYAEPDPCHPASRKPKKCACPRRSCTGDRRKCNGDGRRKNTDYGKSVSSDRNNAGSRASFQEDKIVVNRICDKLSSIITKMCCMLETLADTPVPCVSESPCALSRSDVSQTKSVESVAADCPCVDVPSEPADNKPADNVHDVKAPKTREPVADSKPSRSETAAKPAATKPAAKSPREHKRVISDKSVSDKRKDGDCSRKINRNNSRSRAENKKKITN